MNRFSKLFAVPAMSALAALGAMTAASHEAAARKLTGGEVAALAIVGAAAVVALSQAKRSPQCFQKTSCRFNHFGDEVCTTRRVCR